MNNKTLENVKNMFFSDDKKTFNLAKTILIQNIDNIDEEYFWKDIEFISHVIIVDLSKFYNNYEDAYKRKTIFKLENYMIPNVKFRQNSFGTLIYTKELNDNLLEKVYIIIYK